MIVFFQMSEELTLVEAVYTAIAGFALIMSVVNNALTIAVLIRNPSFRSATNIFLANLAFSDICFGGIVLPTQLHDISHTDEFHEGE